MTSSPVWVDTHCHVYDEAMKTDHDEVLNTARANGVAKMIVIGTDATTSRQAIDIAAQHDDVWATVGLHPHDAKDGFASLRGMLDEPKVVAIGECGLDYYYDHSDRAVQRDVFAEQIAVAHERNLPLVIHTREAWDDTFDVLDACGTPERTIFHCFTGGEHEARECVKRGAYLSFSGIGTLVSTRSSRDRDRCTVPRASSSPWQTERARTRRRRRHVHRRPAWHGCRRIRTRHHAQCEPCVSRHRPLA
jgi:TatD DNase family protein